jgi:hypothetical protein
LRLRIHKIEDRHTRKYRAFKASILLERPICEHCNDRPSAIVAHLAQPLFSGGLMDKSNVLALCVPCDRDYTRSHPALRRRKKRKKL